MSDVLIVAGFHRSGTSLTAQLLQAAGMFLGDDLLGANPSNPYGHVEDREVIRLHERLLAAVGLTWQVDRRFVPLVMPSMWRDLQRFVERRTVSHVRWGFKDPRACPFIPVWKHLVPQARVLIVYRHFTEATYSLSRRHAYDLFRREGDPGLHTRIWSDPDLVLRMWVAHNQALVDAAETYPDDVTVVSFDMLQDGFPLVDHLNERFDLRLDPVPTAAVFDPSVTRRRPGRQPVADRRLVPAVERTWAALEELTLAGARSG